MHIAPEAVEQAAQQLYVRALKVLPPDIQQGLAQARQSERSMGAQAVLDTLLANIRVAERDDNLLCQDTGLPIYTVHIGTGVRFEGAQLVQAIRRGCARATREHPLRSSVVHPLTRVNEHSSCGVDMPLVFFEFDDTPGRFEIVMVPKGSGSENNSFLRMAVPAEGQAAIKTFVIDCVLAAGGKTCPPTIVGVGVGGTSDWCVHLAKRAATRALGSVCADPQGAALERALSAAVNQLGIGPQGLGGDSTAFAVHVELAATHITMNPVAVNMQCHSARRARAIWLADGAVDYGF